MWELGLKLFIHFSGGGGESSGGDDPALSPLRWPHRFRGLIPGRHQ